MIKKHKQEVYLTVCEAVSTKKQTLHNIQIICPNNYWFQFFFFCAARPKAAAMQKACNERFFLLLIFFHLSLIKGGRAFVSASLVTYAAA